MPMSTRRLTLYGDKEIVEEVMVKIIRVVLKYDLHYSEYDPNHKYKVKHNAEQNC